MDTTMTLAVAIAGIAAVPVLQVIKRYTGLTGAAMYWVGLVVAFAIALVAIALSSPDELINIIRDPGMFFGGGGLLMTVAQGVYQTLKKKMGWKGTGK